jgi:heme exporter protein C
MGESSMDPSMMPPLIWMVVATKFFFGAALLDRARNELLDQDRSKKWVSDQVIQAG